MCTPHSPSSTNPNCVLDNYLVIFSLILFNTTDSIVFIRIDAMAMNLTLLGFGISLGFLFSITSLVAYASVGILLFIRQSFTIER